MQWGKVFEKDFGAGVFWFVEVDFADFQKGKITFTVFRWSYLTAYRITGAQIESTNLAG